MPLSDRSYHRVHQVSGELLGERAAGSRRQGLSTAMAAARLKGRAYVSTRLQEHDIVAVRQQDGQYLVCEIHDGKPQRLEGPHERRIAEERTTALAIENRSAAWIEELPGNPRLLPA
jgi:hypothetical protein